MAKRAKTVLAGMDFESGAAERGFGTHQLVKVARRGYEFRFEARADPYGGAPTGAPTKGGTNGRRNQQNNDCRGGVSCSTLPGPTGPGRIAPEDRSQRARDARRLLPG